MEFAPSCKKAMKILKISDHTLDEIVDACATVLRNGGVVAHPTDTCYGLAADISNPLAVEKIAAIKGTSSDKPLSIIVKDIAAISEVADIEERHRNAIHSHLPGRYTLILPKRLDCTYQLEHRSIGVRIPDYEFTKKLIEAFGPVTTTSANITGHAPLYDAGDVMKEFAETAVQPDLVVDLGLLVKNPPSTILDLTDKQEKKLR